MTNASAPPVTAARLKRGQREHAPEQRGKRQAVQRRERIENNISCGDYGVRGFFVHSFAEPGRGVQRLHRLAERLFHAVGEPGFAAQAERAGCRGEQRGEYDERRGEYGCASFRFNTPLFGPASGKEGQPRFFRTSSITFPISSAEQSASSSVFTSLPNSKSSDPEVKCILYRAAATFSGRSRPGYIRSPAY